MVPRSKLVDLVQFAEALQAESGFAIACFGHAGDGNIHVNIMVPDMDDPAQRSGAEQALDKLFRHVLSLGGVISGEHGIGLLKMGGMCRELDPGSVLMQQAVKAALDPLDLFNPGKVLPATSGTDDLAPAPFGNRRSVLS